MPHGDPVRRVTVFVHGDVQGVGFRWWARARCLELGLTGYARNLVDGRVEVCAQGEPSSLERLLTLLTETPSSTRRPGRVDTCVTLWLDPIDGLRGFGER